MRRLAVVLLLMVLVVLVLGSWWLFTLGHSRPMKQMEIPGTYVQKFPWGTETLSLEQDGTFREEFRYTTGESITNSGRWEVWTSPAGDTIVQVSGAVIWPDFRGPQHGPGPLTYTFRARELSERRVLEREHDPDGAVRLVRTP